MANIDRIGKFTAIDSQHLNATGVLKRTELALFQKAERRDQTHPAVVG